MNDTTRTTPRIAIVGAGIAGMNAALTLHDAGIEADIYEASGHIGGRMHSDATTWRDSMVTEWCGEFIDGNHTAIRQLAARFGLSLVDLGAQGGSYSERILYFLNRYVSEDEMNNAFDAITPVLQQQIREASFPTTYDHYTEVSYRLDHTSVYDWIEQYVEHGHKSFLGRMLNGACRGIFGLETDAQSSLNLLYTFGSQFIEQESANNTNATQSQGQGTSKIVGGNQRLPEAIAACLPERSVHLNIPLVGLWKNDDHTVTLSLRENQEVIHKTYDHVILTLPFSTLRHLDYHRAGFDARKCEAIEQLGYGTISKLIMQFDSRYWYSDGPWPSPNNGFVVSDLDFQTLWDTSRGQHGTHGLLLDYTSGHKGASYKPATPYSTTDDSEQVQHYAHECLRQMEQVFPGISSHYTGRAALSYPTGDPNLLGSYSCWCVGQYTQFGGYERVPQGAIHFAGEHCSIEWQGYMEGGAREGARAAKEILASIPH